MLVIIEGIDGSGKTTLYNTLINEYGYKPLDKIPYDKNMRNNWLYVTEENSKENDIVISDRSFITDVIYRMLNGEKSEFNLQDLAKLLKNVKIVYCWTDSAYEDSIKRGEDNITTKTKSNRLADLYDFTNTFLKTVTNVPIIHYNWKIHKTISVVKFINRGNYGN